jgi:hypothetical protein
MNMKKRIKLKMVYILSYMLNNMVIYQSKELNLFKFTSQSILTNSYLPVKNPQNILLPTKGILL